MTTQPLVSIALCTYNGAAYLAEQLDSLIAQSYKNIEIVAVDDCSADGTYDLLSKYAAQYAFIKVSRNENNLGFIGNFERAVKLCTADFIALCDQDDIWHPDKIALQLEAMGDNVLIYHDSEFIHADGTAMNKRMSDVLNLYRGDRPETFLFFNCVSGHAVLMKKELLDFALPLKEGYFHDWWLAYVATNIGRIDFLPQCLVKYRQHDKSDTNILGIARDKDKYKFSSVSKLQRIHNWLGLCRNFKHNRDQQLVEEFYDAFSQRMKSYVSLRLSFLLFKHRKAIFQIRKKGKLSKLNYIFGQVWGARMKAVNIKGKS